MQALTKDGRPIAAAALNAGVGVYGRFDETRLDDQLRLVALNVASCVHLAHGILGRMVAEGGGRLLVTSSVASQMPGPNYSTYAASKSFLQSFAEAVRRELTDTGVTVTALLPGPTDTDFFERADMQDTRVGSTDKDDPADVARSGFDALMAGKDQGVAGSVMNKAQVAAGKLVPDWLKARIHEGMTAPTDDWARTRRCETGPSRWPGRAYARTTYARTLYG
ncbi:MAG: SDR family NAD(P)-dependent oxidoreductase [Marmoricola sp.]